MFLSDIFNPALYCYDDFIVLGEDSMVFNRGESHNSIKVAYKVGFIFCTKYTRLWVYLSLFFIYYSNAMSYFAFVKDDFLFSV